MCYFIGIRSLKIDDFNTNSIQHIDSHKKSYLFTKVEDYSAESEYRIAIYHETFEKDNREFEQFFYHDSVVAIIIGCNFNEAYKVNMVDILKRMGIPLFQLQWLHGKIYLSDSFYTPA